MDPNLTELRRFVSELRRRRVFRVAAVYAAVMFVVLQAADLILPALLVPDWAFRLLVVFTLAGLPVAVLLAWAYEITPDGIRRTDAGPARDPGSPAAPGEPAARPARLIPRPALVLGVLALLAAGTLLWALGRDRAGAPDLDAWTVAVLPFRTAGADPSLAYLREGVVDLLGVTLQSGDGNGLRAVDSRTLLSRWHREIGGDSDGTREAALRVAAELGAGRAILGEVVGTPANVMLTASVVRVPHGTSVGAPIQVSGPADSLAVLVERLTAAVITAELGAAEERRSAFTATPLPALRSYLNGMQAYRRGDYAEAMRHFERAVDIDSTFGLAGIGLAEASGWARGIASEERHRGLRLAWADAERLSGRDRAYLEAMAGPRYPLEPAAAELLEAAHAARRAAPDRAEAWLWVGEHYYHWGEALGVADWDERAWHAFERAVDLDSTYTPAMQHLIELASMRRDTAAVRRLGDHYLSIEAESGTRDYLEWRIAAALGDTTRLRLARSRFEEMGALPLLWVAGAAVYEGRHLEDADAAMEAAFAAAEPDERLGVHISGLSYALDRGRVARHIELGAALLTGPRDVVPPSILRSILVFGGLYGDGDPDVAAAAVRDLERAASSTPAPEAGSPAAGDRLFATCVSAQWNAWQAETSGLADAVRALRSADFTADESGSSREYARFCADLLEAIVATVERRPDAVERARELDAFMRTAPPIGFWNYTGNVAAARLLELNGDPDAALAAIRRRWRRGLPPPANEAYALREEGRLASIVGDREGAARAYAHFLALTEDAADARLEPEIERARARLAELADTDR